MDGSYDKFSQIGSVTKKNNGPCSQAKETKPTGGNM